MMDPAFWGQAQPSQDLSPFNPPSALAGCCFAIPFLLSSFGFSSFSWTCLSTLDLSSLVSAFEPFSIMDFLSFF